MTDDYDPNGDRLRYIEKVDYRGHAIKIARRGDEIRLLVYPPDALLATYMVVDRLSNYEEAINVAKVKIDRMISSASGAIQRNDDPGEE